MLALLNRIWDYLNRPRDPKCRANRRIGECKRNKKDYCSSCHVDYYPGY